MRFVLGLVFAVLVAAPASAQRFDPVAGIGEFKVSELPLFLDRRDDATGFDKCRATLSNGVACQFQAKGARLTIHGNQYGNVIGVEASIPEASADEGVRSVQQALKAIGIEAFPLEDQIARVRSAKPVENRFGALLVSISVSRGATWFYIRGPSG